MAHRRRRYARTNAILLIQDLHVIIVNIATGETLPDLIIDPQQGPLAHRTPSRPFIKASRTCRSQVQALRCPETSQLQRG